MDNSCTGKKQCCNNPVNKDQEVDTFMLGVESGKRSIKQELLKVVSSHMTDSALRKWLESYLKD